MTWEGILLVSLCLSNTAVSERFAKCNLENPNEGFQSPNMQTQQFFVPDEHNGRVVSGIKSELMKL